MERCRGARRNLARIPIACLLALLVSAPAFAGEVIVDFLDVGQGDSILIRGGGKTVLIDASFAKANAAGQLKALGVETIDLVVATHPHADHIGGMQAVLHTFPVGLYMDNGFPHDTVLYGELMAAVEEKEIPYRTARTGMVMRLGDEGTFTVLFPDETPLKDTRSDLNANSVVLRFDHGDVSFLFMGDAEEPTERLVLGRGIDDVDVLKVAHHGGEHSTIHAFLDRTSPEYAVISVGSENRYGHPSPETIERLKSAGAAVFRTDLSGHVRAISNGREVEFLEGPLVEIDSIPVVTVPSSRTPATMASTRAEGGLPSPGGAHASREKTRAPKAGEPAAEPSTGAVETASAVAAPPSDPLLSGVQKSTQDFSDIQTRPKRTRRDSKKRDRESP